MWSLVPGRIACCWLTIAFSFLLLFFLFVGQLLASLKERRSAILQWINTSSEENAGVRVTKNFGRWKGFANIALICLMQK